MQRLHQFLLIASPLAFSWLGFMAVHEFGHVLAAAWEPWLFAVCAITPGFWLWHGLGPHFGLGAKRGKVSLGATLTAGILAGLIAALERWFHPDGVP